MKRKTLRERASEAWGRTNLFIPEHVYAKIWLAGYRAKRAATRKPK